MTDARLRGEWLNAMEFDDLSDAAWRVFTGALMWSAENGTDGLIPKRYLRMLHPEGERPEAFGELDAAGIWASAGDDKQMLDWDGKLGQSTALQVQTYKENGRNRARTFRERERMKLAKAISPKPSPEALIPEVTRYETRDVRAHVGVGEGERAGRDSGGSTSSLESRRSATELLDSEVTAPTGPRPEDARDAPKSGGLNGMLDHCKVCRSPLAWPMARNFAICDKDNAAHRTARDQVAA